MAFRRRSHSTKPSEIQAAWRHGVFVPERFVDDLAIGRAQEDEHRRIASCHHQVHDLLLRATDDDHRLSTALGLYRLMQARLGLSHLPLTHAVPSQDPGPVQMAIGGSISRWTQYHRTHIADANDSARGLQQACIIAAAAGDVPLTTLALAMGADPNHPGYGHEQSQEAPLLRAARSCHPVIVRLLLGKRANHGVVDAAGRTPLMLAAQCGGLSTTDSVAALLAAGADVHARDANGRTALHHAIRKMRGDVADMLMHHGAGRDDQASLVETLVATNSRSDWPDLATPLIHQGNDPVSAALEITSPGLVIPMIERALAHAPTDRQASITDHLRVCCMRQLPSHPAWAALWLERLAEEPVAPPQAIAS